MGYRKALRRIEKASYLWNDGLRAFSGIIILVLMMLIVSDVSGRYLFLRPITGSVEIGQMMLAWVAFLTLAYALIKKTHVRVTLALSRFPQRVQLRAEIFAGLAGIAFFSFMTWGAILQFWSSWVVRELMPAAIDLPYWLPKLILLVGALFMTIQCIIYTLGHLDTLLLKRRER